jgi:hypothetical protein
MGQASLRSRGALQGFPTLSRRPPKILSGNAPRRLVAGNVWATVVPCHRPKGGRRIGVVKRSAVGTGPLRRSPAVHSQPIDLVVFQEPSHCKSAGNLVLEGASRLDAFSAYPVPTWLPGDAPSGTAGTPEVGPPQSSRTRGDSPQVSYAHGR